MTPIASALLLMILVQPAAAAQQPSLDPLVQARTLLAAMAAGDFAQVEERFTDQMKAALPPGRLAGTWAKLRLQGGAFKQCGTDPKVVAIADKQMVITPCEFERATFDFQFAFDSAGRVSGIAVRPTAGSAAAVPLPPYADPRAFTESDVTIGTGERALPGTLTVPAGSGPFPAVVLVHGSGPNDRDETVGPNKPFRDLATGLASRGIAVLRYDKRTRVHPGSFAGRKDFTTKDEVVDDVVAAAKMLRAQARVDSARVFVLGHSLGGMLIPRIAAADPSTAGLIVLAGAARPLEEAMLAQTRYIVSTDGTVTPQEQQAIDQAVALGASVRALTPEDVKSGRSVAGVPASYWLDLRGYDPPAEAARVKQPMLILQGERDYQVTMEDFARWKAALGTRPDVTFRSYPALNHLFIAGTGRSMPAEYEVTGHVAEDVIRDIAGWILKAPR